MKYTKLERQGSAFQEVVPPEMIEQLCLRAFGDTTAVVAARELGNGEYNNVYLIEFSDREAVILRVAPRSASDPEKWLEHSLMRREYLLQPYFAPLAPLIPKILMLDFTHQLIERDYMFQTYMPGTLWSTVMKELSDDENDALWRQFAGIARTIASIKGEFFGLPYPGLHFATWSEKVQHALEQSLREAERYEPDADPIRQLLDIAVAHSDLLDEVTTPRLLHGDLWPFNILIQHKEEGPVISAVLDADRGYWGDPLADWTFNLLERRVSPHVREVFWQEFGQPQATPGQRFRTIFYRGMHCCHVLCWLQQLKQTQYQQEVYVDLYKALADLRSLQ